MCSSSTWPTRASGAADRRASDPPGPGIGLLCGRLESAHEPPRGRRRHGRHVPAPRHDLRPAPLRATARAARRARRPVRGGERQPELAVALVLRTHGRRRLRRGERPLRLRHGPRDAALRGRARPRPRPRPRRHAGRPTSPLPRLLGRGRLHAHLGPGRRRGLGAAVLPAPDDAGRCRRDRGDGREGVPASRRPGRGRRTAEPRVGPRGRGGGVRPRGRRRERARPPQGHGTRPTPRPLGCRLGGRRRRRRQPQRPRDAGRRGSRRRDGERALRGEGRGRPRRAGERCRRVLEVLGELFPAHDRAR